MRLPWSVRHYLKYRKHLTHAAVLSLRRALIAERDNAIGYFDTIDVHLKHLRTPLRLRPRSNDIYTFDEVFEQGVYASLLRGNDAILTVMDLGANIGLSALYFLHHCPNCQVYCVEPDRDNFRLLSWNTSQKPWVGRVGVLQAAACGVDGRVHFQPPTTPGLVNQGAIATSASGSSYTVPGLTINSIISKSGFDTIDILKIDIEGAERSLFENVEWLARVKCLAVEFHGDARVASRFDAVMMHHGFTCTDHGHTVIARRSVS